MFMLRVQCSIMLILLKPGTFGSNEARRLSQVIFVVFWEIFLPRRMRICYSQSAGDLGAKTEPAALQKSV